MRKALGIKPGDKLIMVADGNLLTLVPKPKSYRKAATGLVRGVYPPDYLKQERESWE